ncbi:rust resistance kinase Lr10-like isoform X2 [Salvia miltiorrhiza]|uniref:rust resistance kinase Lr10-like isoform X2 n=1 Tax=Salvia miltiorrhiza TaxID=226208 RepID=UPI0025AC0C1C|nr:rust resistance kinase Lr10-like isoform X2 [Salvia miltiorrhiza]
MKVLFGQLKSTSQSTLAYKQDYLPFTNMNSFHLSPSPNSQNYKNPSNKMSAFFFNFLFIVFAFFSPLPFAEADNCWPDSCRRGGPRIRFPFRIRNKQSPNCGYPGFDVYCNDKGETMLDLPISVNLTVKRIHYKSQRIDLSDPEKCLGQKLQTLNLSSSPFRFFTDYLEDYVLFSCPDSKRDLSNPVACLRDSRYQFYAVRNDSYMDSVSLTSCTNEHNVSSVPYYVFKKNDVYLNWSEPACGGSCEALGRICAPPNNSTAKFQCVDKGKSNEVNRKIRIAGATVGSFLMLTTIAALIFLCITIIKDRENRKKIEGFLDDYKALKPTRFGYSDIRKITNQFSEKLGEGGYGIVYKGKLSTEISVAVKVLNNSKENGEEFVNEVSTIGRIHHVNVVRLVGFCAEGFRRVLVYEFLPNDSLEKFIFQEDSKRSSLSWEKLLDIALGTAKGIEYLHQGCDQQILHFDIKPHNILLDQNFNPKVCDFGLAKLCSKEQSAVTMTAARGTMGYIAPELLSRTFGRVSYKSDVYSFGMLLLEMVGGRKNVDLKINNSQVYFPQWIYNHLNLGDEFWVHIEEGEHQSDIARKLTVVGLHCIQWYPADRPSMKAVVQMLEGDGSDLEMPPNPFPTANATNLVAGIIPQTHFQIELPLILENE